MICKICNNEFEKKHFNQKLCSIECKKKSRENVIKNYKLSELGRKSEKRWRKSATRKESQKKYTKSEKEKELARNRSKIYNLTRFGKLKSWFDSQKVNGCKKCGSFEKLSVDHIVPFHISKNNSLDNLQILCVPCNGKKGDFVWLS